MDNNQRRPIRWMILAFMLSFITGCVGGGSPPTHFYVLDATAQPVEKTAASTLVIALEPIEIPKYLDRSQIVSRSGDNQLEVASFHQWGGGLTDNISRVMAENLSRTLANDHVYTLPDRGLKRPDYRLLVTLLRFEADKDNRLLLDARWRLAKGLRGKVVALKRFRWYGQPLPAGDYAALTAEMSRALAGLGQRVAKQLTAMHSRR